MILWVEAANLSSWNHVHYSWDSRFPTWIIGWLLLFFFLLCPSNVITLLKFPPCLHGSSFHMTTRLLLCSFNLGMVSSGYPTIYSHSELRQPSGINQWLGIQCTCTYLGNSYLSEGWKVAKLLAYSITRADGVSFQHVSVHESGAFFNNVLMYLLKGSFPASCPALT